MNRKQQRHQNKLNRQANIKRKKALQQSGTHQTVPKGLSGPERWALINQINPVTETDTRTLKQLVAEHRADQAKSYTHQGKQITKAKSTHYITKQDYKKLKSI